MTGARTSGRLTPGASLRLPIIQHPLSRMADPESISLKGHSTNGAKEAAFCGTRRGRPLSHEEGSPLIRSHTSKSKRLPRFEKDAWMEEDRHPLSPPHIPEGVKVTSAADPDKPRLPIFGQRAAAGSRAESLSSWTTCRTSFAMCPGTRLRIQVDQLEHEVRERLRGGGSAHLRRLFSNNNRKGRGQMDRDLLLLVLTKFLGRFISVRQFRQLLLRLHLAEKPVITYEELRAILGAPVGTQSQDATGPIQQPTGATLWTSSQVHSLLRGPERNRFLDAVESLQSKGIEGPSWITAPQLKKILEELGLYMESRDFMKLWRRYDESGLGAIKMESMWQKLGANLRKRPDSGENKGERVSKEADRAQNPKRSLSEAEEERRGSVAVERWLKERFREGVQNLKAEFDKLDPDKTGKVQPDGFLRVLRKFNLHLRRKHLGLFLARCGLEVQRTGIDYPEFLRRFQDRGDEGVLQRILSDPKHKFHEDGGTGHASSVTVTEARLAHLFQSEYLGLLEAFRSLDKYGKKTVSQEEFRAVLESRFQLVMTDPQFEQLLDSLPLDEDGNVQYALFMAPFDTRGGAASLFEAQAKVGESQEAAREEPREAGQDRSNAELFRIIKNLIRRDFQALQGSYEQMDAANTRRMSQETMFQLLRKFNIQPEVSRGEIRRLWGTLLTNRDHTLDFLHFVRHFGHSPKSACFPNAKVSPPRWGDADRRRRSRKLNAVYDILTDNVRAKVELLHHDLQGEFEDLDPYRTGFVSREEFGHILRDLCSQLTRHECNILGEKFDVNGDGRVSYMEFLKPFASQERGHPCGSNMAVVLHSSQDSGGPPAEETPRGSGPRLKQREVRALRRAFRKLDGTGRGLLPTTEFRAVLKLHGLAQDDEKATSMLAPYQRGDSGLVDYSRFLQEACGWRACRSTAASDSTSTRTSLCTSTCTSTCE
ncbi:EF-hand calcium-binding domain-containing protein 6 isoform X2 [Brienomyrus brachyistius]|uniref:EF-hand calcium-binding domain-containing protein 6 isoform X2 n=1 Tax=Brienomyrus brachyistius TaxID=42636 RepID=UPI0020B1E646|nr:EF-hand calcium-binding domain-containing protein 6 isoform X2 [Brienomyrus brachyistius]